MYSFHGRGFPPFSFNEFWRPLLKYFLFSFINYSINYTVVNLGSYDAKQNQKAANKHLQRRPAPFRTPPHPPHDASRPPRRPSASPPPSSPRRRPSSMAPRPPHPDDQHGSSLVDVLDLLGGFLLNISSRGVARGPFLTRPQRPRASRPSNLEVGERNG